MTREPVQTAHDQPVPPVQPKAKLSQTEPNPRNVLHSAQLGAKLQEASEIGRCSSLHVGVPTPAARVPKAVFTSTFRILFWLMNATMKPVIGSVTPCGLLLMQCRAGAPSARERNGTGADGRARPSKTWERPLK
jgi:hypothetical protein